MNRKGAETAVVLIVAVIILFIVIGGIFYIRNNVSTWVLNVTPGLVTSAQTACTAGVQSGLSNEVCFKLFKIGEGKGSTSYVTCSELNENPSKYGVIFNADVKASLDAFFQGSGCSVADINKSIAQECLKFGSGLDKVGVNGKNCVEFVVSGSCKLKTGQTQDSYDCDSLSSVKDCLVRSDCEWALN
jgi:hypothetical protein